MPPRKWTVARVKPYVHRRCADIRCKLYPHGHAVYVCLRRLGKGFILFDLPNRDRFILVGFIRQNGKGGRPQVVMRPAPFGALCVYDSAGFIAMRPLGVFVDKTCQNKHPFLVGFSACRWRKRRRLRDRGRRLRRGRWPDRRRRRRGHRCPGSPRPRGRAAA